MPVHPLPKSIQKVEIPEVFAISRLPDIESCALSAFGSISEECLLPPEPRALFGTLLHHLRAEISAGRWGGRSSGEDVVRDHFALFVADLEEHLGAYPETAILLPLKYAVGRRRWNDGLRQLTEWASRQVDGGIELPHQLAFGPEIARRSEIEGSKWNQIGIEKPVRCTPLRLVGRPDLTKFETGRVIDIIDFKSGRITNPDGNIHAGIVLQLQAYALVLEAAFPEYEFRLFVEGGERLPVSFLSFAAGLMAAAEMVKLATPGYPKSGNRVFFNSKDLRFVKASQVRIADCPVCSTRSPKVHRALIDGTLFAGMG